jgi:hypothetical protein
LALPRPISGRAILYSLTVAVVPTMLAPVPGVGYVAAGTIQFQIRGQPAQYLRSSSDTGLVSNNAGSCVVLAGTLFGAPSRTPDTATLHYRERSCWIRIAHAAPVWMHGVRYRTDIFWPQIGVSALRRPNLTFATDYPSA